MLNKNVLVMVFSILFLIALVSNAMADEIVNNNNGNAVGSKPSAKTQFTINISYTITDMLNYHYNNGQGVTPGTIELVDSNGKVYGPWNAALCNKFFWECKPNITIPAGTYTVRDSDPATWSCNSSSGNAGFSIIYGDVTSEFPVSFNYCFILKNACNPKYATDGTTLNLYITPGEKPSPDNLIYTGDKRKAWFLGHLASKTDSITVTLHGYIGQSDIAWTDIKIDGAFIQKYGTFNSFPWTCLMTVGPPTSNPHFINCPQLYGWASGDLSGDELPLNSHYFDMYNTDNTSNTSNNSNTSSKPSSAQYSLSDLFGPWVGQADPSWKINIGQDTIEHDDNGRIYTQLVTLEPPLVQQNDPNYYYLPCFCRGWQSEKDGLHDWTMGGNTKGEPFNMIFNVKDHTLVVGSGGKYIRP